MLLTLLSAGLLGVFLSGCTAGASVPPSGVTPTVSVTNAENGSEIGNGRPTVSFDGPLVQRRVVLAVEADADLPALRARLEQRASASHLALTDISPDVLPAGVLEQGVPQLTVLLSAGATRDEARALLASDGPESIDSYFVLSVLVHDLRFVVDSADPTALADAVAREGILSDDLGNYGSAIGANTLEVSYLGALLGDDVVADVRGGMARSAGITADQVRVAAGTPGGAGVDMAAEPEPAAVVIADSDASHGHDGSVSATAATSPGPAVNAWSVYGIGLTVLLIGSVGIMIWTGRRRSAASEIEPEPRDRE